MKKLEYHHHIARHYRKHLWLRTTGIAVFMLGIVRLFYPMPLLWYLGTVLCLCALSFVLIATFTRRWAQQRALRWLDNEIGLSYRSALEYPPTTNPTEQQIHHSLTQRALRQTKRLSLPEPRAWWLPLWLFSALLLIFPSISLDIPLIRTTPAVARNTPAERQNSRQRSSEQPITLNEDNIATKTEQQALDSILERWNQPKNVEESSQAPTAEAASGANNNATTAKTAQNDNNQASQSRDTEPLTPLQSATDEDIENTLTDSPDDFLKNDEASGNQQNTNAELVDGAERNNQENSSEASKEKPAQSAENNDRDNSATRPNIPEGMQENTTLSPNMRSNQESQSDRNAANSANPDEPLTPTDTADEAQQQSGEQTECAQASESGEQSAQSTEHVAESETQQQVPQAGAAGASTEKTENTEGLEGIGSQATAASATSRERLGDASAEEAALLSHSYDAGQRIKLGERRGGNVTSMEEAHAIAALPSFAEATEKVISEGSVPLEYHESLRNYFR